MMFGTHDTLTKVYDLKKKIIIYQKPTMTVAAFKTMVPLFNPRIHYFDNLHRS